MTKQDMKSAASQRPADNAADLSAGNFTSGDRDKFLQFVTELFRRGEKLAYGKGQVSMCAHMLQTADLAAKEDASPALVVAALLHDIGHFGTDYPLDFEDARHAAMLAIELDHCHEEVGAAVLKTYYGPEVTEPVRLHVPAKRYLCSVDAEYYDGLSETTRHTLRLQGGPMTPAESDAFAAQPFAEDATRLRRWDDLAMVAERAVPDFDHYRGVLSSTMR
ncbi:MAG: HD domain-containing protein [Hyphomicrobiales bacterium]|nr:HD domain-containing protein [Hyphomicrobiales bacterium]